MRFVSNRGTPLDTGKEQRVKILQAVPGLNYYLH